MKSLILVVLGVVVGALLVVAEKKQALKKYVDQGVEITILYLPPDCTYKSQDKDMLETEYVGKFLDGTKFDSTYDRKEPMSYTMGAGNVIKGCEIGTMNMCKGEKRYLVIPPELAYGQEQYAQIPPNSTLTFEITLTGLMEDPFKNFENIDSKKKPKPK